MVKMCRRKLLDEPTLNKVPFLSKSIAVTYAYNEIDQLVYEYGYEYGLKIGWGSPYEVWYDYDARVQLAIWWWYDLEKSPRYMFNVPVSIACTQEGPCNCYSWRNAVLQQAGLGPVDDNAFWHPID